MRWHWIIILLLVSCTTAPKFDPAVISNATEPPVSTDPIDNTKIVELTFKEGDLVSFPNLAEEDEDGDTITYEFTSPLDEEGMWQTEEGDAGSYDVLITATDEKGASTEQFITLIIESQNAAPTIIIDDLTVTEGETVVLEPNVKDEDGDEVSISFSGWMTSSFKATTFTDAGEYEVIITATDAKGASTTERVLITVLDQNQKPIVDIVEDITVIEGERVAVEVVAEDPEGESMTFSFSPPLDSNGEWQTEVGDAGSYETRVIVSDGKDTTERDFAITVQPLNQPPQLIIEEKFITVIETETVSLQIDAQDPEGTAINLDISGWMTEREKETTYDDAGQHEVIITATDEDGYETTEIVQVTVKDKNRPPQIII